MRKGIKRLLLFALTLALTMSAAQATAIPALVNTNGLPVFSRPVYSASTLITTLDRGYPVYVLGISGAWACVTNNGKVIGYTGVDYLTPVSALTSSASVNRVKGYTSQDTLLFSGPSTASIAIMALSAGTEVYLIGVSGSFGRVQNAAGTITGYVYGGHLSQNPPSAVSEYERNKAAVIKVDWCEVGRHVLERGSIYQLYDIYNHQFIRVKYTTGSDHMDIEPVTAADTAKLKAALGGSWTWRRLPIILIAEGAFIAASLYGEPHGGTDTISGNGMDGVVCLHLTNSRTHGSDRVDEDHQAAINAAYAWAHS